MALENLDINEIRKQFTEICKAEKGVLDEQRKIAKKLRAKRLPLDLKKWKGKAISFVATDGGDNRIRLDSSSAEAPAVVELVRIADSDGKSIMAPVAGTADNVNFDEIDNLDAVKELCKDLGRKKISDLSSYEKDQQSEQASDGKSLRSEHMRVYREIAEWAVFYELLKKCKSDTLVVRDGTLRTRVLEPNVFRILDDKIEKVVKSKPNGINVYCVGVAKQTVLLNRLRLAMSMEDVFGKGAQYIPVKDEIAEKFYDRRWLDPMAKMYLVKFGDHPLDPVWPVDIAAWQETDVEKILGYLAQDARPGFPIPDFPMCIQKAHEHAKIGGIEMAYLQELLFDEMESSMSKADSKKILLVRYLMEDVSARRYPK